VSPVRRLLSASAGPSPGVRDGDDRMVFDADIVDLVPDIEMLLQVCGCALAFVHCVSSAL
jgi:hypothetical protein